MKIKRLISLLLILVLLGGSMPVLAANAGSRQDPLLSRSYVQTWSSDLLASFLQSSGFRLSSFISDIFGASGRNIILHLIEHGQIDKTALDSCLKTKTRNRIDEILMSVNGTLSEHQKAFLRILMTHYDSLKKHLAEIETSLEEDMAPFALQVEQLNSIYGISTTASCAIIAEIGIDMKPFKTAEHICSWAGLCPGNNESAGKRKSTSVTKGNPYIKSMLCEIAWVIACLLYTSDAADD